MNPIALILIYAVMIIFDGGILAGTVWLIVEKDWSAWWLLAAVIIMSGSNPRRLILASQGIDAKAST